MDITDGDEDLADFQTVATTRLPNTYMIDAYIVFGEQVDLSYPGIPGDSKHRRVEKQLDGRYFHRKTGQYFQHAEQFYLLRVLFKALDNDDLSFEAFLFDDAGRTLFGMKCDALVKLREDDQEAFYALMRQKNRSRVRALINVTPGVFDVINDETRMKYSVNKLVLLD